MVAGDERIKTGSNLLKSDADYLRQSIEGSDSVFINKDLSQNYQNFNNEAIRISELLDSNALTRDDMKK